MVWGVGGEGAVVVVVEGVGKEGRGEGEGVALRFFAIGSSAYIGM